MVIALPCAAGQQVLVAYADCYLLSAGCASALVFSSSCTPGGSGGCSYPNTDRSVTTSNSGQSSAGLTVKGLKTAVCSGTEQTAGPFKYNVKTKWCWKKNPSVPNSYSLISTAITHKALQGFLKMRRWNISRGHYSGCLQYNVG